MGINTQTIPDALLVKFRTNTSYGFTLAYDGSTNPPDGLRPTLEIINRLVARLREMKLEPETLIALLIAFGTCDAMDATTG